MKMSLVLDSVLNCDELMLFVHWYIALRPLTKDKNIAHNTL